MHKTGMTVRGRSDFAGCGWAYGIMSGRTARIQARKARIF